MESSQTKENKYILARVSDEDINSFSDLPECGPGEIKVGCTDDTATTPTICYLCCYGAWGQGWHIVLDQAGQSIRCNDTNSDITVNAIGARITLKGCQISQIER